MRTSIVRTESRWSMLGAARMALGCSSAGGGAGGIHGERGASDGGVDPTQAGLACATLDMRVDQP